MQQYRQCLVAGAMICSAIAAAAQEGPPPTPVVAATVTLRDAPASIRLVGTVIAQRESIVASELSGIVTQFSAAEGQFLKTGDLIAELDPAPTQFRLDEATAMLAKLNARLAELLAGTRAEELRRAEASAAEAQAMADKWSFERSRMANLREKAQANEKELHDAEMELLAAQRRLAQEQARLELARNGARKEEIDAAKAEAAAQHAVVQRMQRELSKLRVRAPFDGFIVSKNTEVGQWIAEGGAVASMVSVDQVRVRADAPESAVRFSVPGAPAVVEVEALERTESATITRIIPKAAATARTFPIEVELKNSDHKMLPGMFAWVYAPAGPSGKRLMVSKDAVVSRGREKSIYLIRGGATPAGGPPASSGGANGGSTTAPPPAPLMAVPLPITTGLEVGGEIEIIAAGIEAGDRVVARANERLYGPTPVVIFEPPASQPTSSPAASTR